MGIDYSPVGGIGIEIDEEMRSLIEFKYYVNTYGIGKIEDLEDLEEYEELDFQEILEECFLPYSMAGCSYSGNHCYYLMVKGETLLEIENNYQEFIDSLKEYGISIIKEDLMVVSDLLVW